MILEFLFNTYMVQQLLGKRKGTTMDCVELSVIT